MPAGKARIPGRSGETGSRAADLSEVDRRSEALIIERLTPTFDRFGIGLLTEERDDDGGRLTADLFWCVDPLDGTLAFVEGRRGFAVSVALEVDGVLEAGCIADPRAAAVALGAYKAFRAPCIPARWDCPCGLSTGPGHWGGD